MKNPVDIITKAQNVFNQGNYRLATKLIKQIDNYEMMPDAVYLLGLCKALSNNYSAAEDLFKKTAALVGPSEILHGNIGLSQLHQGKIQDSIQSFKTAIELNPDYYDAIKNLAVAYDHINEHNEAALYAEKVNNEVADDPAIINILARHASHDKDIKRALTLFSRSLELLPEQPHIYTQISNTYVIAKEYDSAEKVLKLALVHFPGNLFLHFSLANYYESRNRYSEALDQYNNILTRNTNNTAAISSKSRVLIALKQFDLANDTLQKGHAAFPDDPGICAELCNYYILNKNYEESYKLSKHLISSINAEQNIPANIALAHSTACRHTNRLNEAREILTSVINIKTTPANIQETLLYSMGDTLDSLGQYDDAFRYYKLANEIIHTNSDIDYYESILNDIIKSVDREYLDKIGTSGNQTSLPVFIVGMPRSGTSLVEQILSSHPDVYGAGELTDLWSIGNMISDAMNLTNYTSNLLEISNEKLYEYTEMYIQKLVEVSNYEARVTDKLPHNFMHIGLIELLFPNAIIIHCQRHPFDTCLSIYFKKFNDNHTYAKNLEELARFYIKYMALMEHWYKNSALTIQTIKYEDIVENQEAESRRMIELIGLEWTDTVLRYFDTGRIIMTPSYHQASKPIYKGSVNRWKNYTRHTKHLSKVLGDPEQYL